MKRQISFSKLLAAHDSGIAPRIQSIKPPTGASRAWAISSARRWDQLAGKAMVGKGEQLPTVVEADGALWIIEAVGKLLAHNAFYAIDSGMAIGRKRYVKLTSQLIDAILEQPLYFEDGFFRSSSAAITADTFDVGLFLRELDGRPTTVEQVVESEVKRRLTDSLQFGCY